MSDYDVLMTPMKVGSIEVKNRFVMCAMGIHSHRLVNPDGSFTDDGIRYYERIAEGGVGLIVTSCMTVNSSFDMSKGSEAAMDRAGQEFIDNTKKFTDCMHKHGTKVFMQLSSGAGRVLPAFIAEGEPIAPSDGLPNFWDPSVKHRALTKEEIQEYIEKFGDAAKKCREAGVDGVEIHAIHEGYLLDQFTLSYCNHRTDEYGGSLEGRLLFAKKIIENIKQKAGADYPVSMRYSVRSFVKDFNKGALPGEDFVEAGRDLEEGLKVAKMLEDYGVDMLDADNGTYDSWWFPHPPVYMDEACNLAECEAVQKVVNIPVVCAGRMENPEVALNAVKEGKVTGVGIARQFLADPDYVQKLQDNKSEEIRPCIACHAGCVNRIFKGQDICCALNPAVAREDVYAITPAETKKKVMVIGGGIGGMEAARVSALRGHDVCLYEKTDKLGGVFIPASAMSFKASDKRLIQWYELQMKELGVDVHMNTTVTKELIDEVNPDVVYQATGSSTRKLNILGNEKTISAIDALNNPELMQGDIVIIGGGLTGVEIAYEYAKQGRNVTVLEAQDKILNVDLAAPNKNFLLAAMDVYNVNVVVNAKVISVDDENVNYEVDGQQQSVKADTTVVSIGYNSYVPFDSLDREMYTIGDAAKVSNLMGAIWTAYETAMNI
ncbi:MAG: FAD-dependent oxidoreductase [Erysipelotrichaceae bacterium]|nr:FAD-dependent oxidoreductase [Erysipelotrichaceae bacterium]